MPNPSIFVLDSGVGGLSVVGNIRKLCPPLQIHYLADLAGFPYGVKTEQQILDRVINLLGQALPLCQPQIVIIACNTASTVVLDELRQRFSLPFIGVVPAIKPAAKLSQTGVIGVLATEGTVNRSYTHNLIKEFAGNQQVLLHGSSKLVLLAEEKLKRREFSVSEICAELSTGFRNAGALDTVVLACTHFPLLKEELAQCLPQVKYWVDSGEAIARRVSYWLDELAIAPKSETLPGINQFFYNGDTPFDYDLGAIRQLLGEFKAERFPAL